MDGFPLKELGLTEYETKAFLTLLKFGSLPCRQAALHSGVPPARIYDTLRSLASKGLVSLVQKEPLTFRALELETAISALVDSKKKRLDELKRDSIQELAGIEHTKKARNVEALPTIMAGKESRFAHSVELTNNARKEKLIISVSDSIPNSSMKANFAALKRGVKIRLIATKFDDENREVIKNYLRLGIPVRYYPQLKGFNLVTFDKKFSLIIIYDPEKKEETMNILIPSAALARAHAEYFEEIWKKAEPVHA